MRVAIPVTEGFEQVELEQPLKALDATGAETNIVSPIEKKVRPWNLTDWGDEFAVDLRLEEARADDLTPCSCRAR